MELFDFLQKIVEVFEDRAQKNLKLAERMNQLLEDIS